MSDVKCPECGLTRQHSDGECGARIAFFQLQKERDELRAAYAASEAERIVAAALQDGDGMVYSMPQPARHHTVIHALFAVNPGTSRKAEQGFLTSRGRFVDRKEGWQIALQCEQLLRLRTDETLFSEDVW